MSTPAVGDRPPGVGEIGPKAASGADRKRLESTRLLERDAPMLQMEEALRAARAGRGHIVSVEGEAGC